VRILIVGATGLIGSAVAARLLSEGHEVVGVSRYPPMSGLHEIHRLRMDLEQTTSPFAWQAHLQSIDAIVNCAGVLQDAPVISRDVCMLKALPFYSVLARPQACAAWCIFPR
jgi:nucleoside-diphosphate-sugar epimerase